MINFIEKPIITNIGCTCIKYAGRIVRKTQLNINPKSLKKIGCLWNLLDKKECEFFQYISSRENSITACDELAPEIISGNQWGYDHVK